MPAFDGFELERLKEIARMTPADRYSYMKELMRKHKESFEPLNERHNIFREIRERQEVEDLENLFKAPSGDKNIG